MDLTVSCGLDKILVTVSLVVIIVPVGGAGDEGVDNDNDCDVPGCTISIECRMDAVRFRLLTSELIVLFSVIEPLCTDSITGSPFVRGAFAMIGNLSPSMERRACAGNALDWIDVGIRSWPVGGAGGGNV